MPKFESVDEVLDFAIRDEEEAAKLYARLAQKMDTPRMREIFEGFAREELEHKKKLLDAKKGKVLVNVQRKILDLKLAEQLMDVPPTEDLDYQQALILAMKAEKAAFQLYSKLAEVADSDDVRMMLEELAREEAAHKLRFELEYEDRFMDENQDWKDKS